ncbi:C40 family peptidase [Planctomonas sp. JC2975]|uniref:C40 family peptidase n=1 Tax=Planctomonas sp. JC2975 TaxID=2729626 RepID=UPI00147381E5|nr:C40 family peptidase [Planctomonas sp. JC2975]NNC11643.1 C40 family peptidase [Planctomonas sp. JC2975]
MATLGTSGPPEDRDPSTTSKAIDSLGETTTMSRRSLRESDRRAADAGGRRYSRSGATAGTSAEKRSPSTSPVPATSGMAKRKRRMRPLVNLAVMLFAGGIVATIAIPAYAFNPATSNQASFGTNALDSMKKAHSQSVRVSGAIDGPAAAGDTFSATSEQQLADQKAATERAAAAAQMQAYAAAYSGPSASDYLANPPYPNFSLAQVFSVAQQYIGTPYVYGGDTPAGFDCSGYVMFVYSQFGISLPHSAAQQGAIGKRISIQDAQPGDVVIMLGGAHDGFYAGNGNILDAPDVGRSVSIRPIWTSDYYIVRFGI